MKKIIATIIRFFMPKAVRERENAKHIHNANILQHLLDAEHDIRDKINEDYNCVFTTKYAIRCANKIGLTHYNSFEALQEADFQ